LRELVKVFVRFRASIKAEQRSNDKLYSIIDKAVKKLIHKNTLLKKSKVAKTLSSFNITIYL
jgi:ribosomal protein S20